MFKTLLKVYSKTFNLDLTILKGMSLEPFLVKHKSIYVTIQSTFERYCKGCSELVEFKVLGVWVQVKCKAEKCVK